MLRYPLCFQGSPQTRQRECFLVFETSLKIPFLGWSSLLTSFVSFFVFYIFSYLFLKTMIYFSGCLLSSASIQKLFCGVCSALNCSFEEFVREKMVFPSYFSAILGTILDFFFNPTFCCCYKSVPFTSEFYGIFLLF